MNTPNRNAVVKMTLDWIDVMEAITEGVDELSDLYFNGGYEHYHDHWFWGNMKRFKEEVWDKHVSAQVDFMQLWHDELDTDIYTSDWLFGIRNEHCIPYELPIIAAVCHLKNVHTGRCPLVHAAFASRRIGRGYFGSARVCSEP
jgi:hypothetical protein